MESETNKTKNIVVGELDVKAVAINSPAVIEGDLLIDADIAQNLKTPGFGREDNMSPGQIKVEEPLTVKRPLSKTHKPPSS